MKRVFLFLFLTSCAVVRPFVASNDDLAHHRAIILARAEGDRLARASRYLEMHPDGAWAKSVRDAFDAEEPAYYASCKKSRAAALDYIAWLPKGPHVQAAFSLVRSFDEHEPDDEQTRMLKAARASEERFERAAEERAAASEAILGALRLVTARDVYGRELGESHDLSRWLLAARNFGGTPTHRTRSLSFTLPSREGPIARELEFTVEIEQRGDVVGAAVVSGPDSFAHIVEAAQLHTAPSAEAERYVHDLIDALLRRDEAHGVHADFAPDRVRFTAE